MTATSNPVLDDAITYLARGWQPIPIPPRSKSPYRRGWQRERWTEDELAARLRDGEHNIGVLLGEPSGGLVDIDLDSPEARALARAFLPKTDARFGRPGSPGAHWLYVADPLVPTTRYQDPLASGDEERGVLVELRSTGGQTIFPPSIHPSGEAIRWEGEGDPAEVDGRELLTQVGRLAAAALLARHWPAKGSRHDAALALAGGLLRAGWDEEAAEAFVGAVAQVAGDEEAAARPRNVSTTARRLASDGVATGWPRLAQLIDPRVVDKVREWLGIRSNDGVSWVVGSADRRDSIRIVEPDAGDVIPGTSEPAWPEPPDPAAYYGLAGEIVRALDPTTEADPVALLASLLAAVGNIVGPGPHWRVSGRRHSLRIYPIMVGPTAKGRKGTAWGSLRPVLEVAAPEWLARNVATGLSSGEGLIWAVRDPIVKTEPVKERGQVVGYQDVTVDHGVADKRLFVIEEEFASVLRVMGRDGNTLSAVIRQAWDDGDLRILTKNTPAKATGAHITILGHITKDELLRYLDSTEAGNGFANRFIWLCVRRSKELPDGGEPDPVVVEELGARLADVLADAPTVTMERDEEAAAMWRLVYGPLSDGGVGLMGAVLSRAEAQVMRLAAVYALLDRSHLIRAPHLEAALALWEYAERSAEYIFGDALGDPVADTILAALRRTGPMTRNDIVNLFGRHVNRARLDRALGALLSASKVQRWQDNDTGGRPAEWWSAA